METEEGAPLPAAFRSVPGGVYPLYHVFRAVGAFSAGDVLEVAAGDPLRVQALALRKENATRVLIANVGSEKTEVALRGLPGERAALHRLDATNAEAAMAAPEAHWQAVPEDVEIDEGEARLVLPPYGLAWLEIAH